MANRRPYQDYQAWPSFLTQDLWNEIYENPTFASEIIAQHLNNAGLINPAETTSADVAAGIVVATYGPLALLQSKDEVDRVYNAFKARART